MQTLVDNIAAFEKQYDYDGVDMDWEYPETTADRKFLVKLMATAAQVESGLRAVDRRRAVGGIWIRPEASAALARLLQYHDVRLRRSVDGIRPAQFADLLGQARSRAVGMSAGRKRVDTANIFLQARSAGKQLNMGTPFYGYQYTNINQLFGLCPNSVYTDDGACDNTVLTVNYGTDVKHRINKKGW